MHQPLAGRLPVGRPVILLGLAFLMGTGLGWAVTRPFAASTTQQISNVDYVAVVAQLFQRDHNQEVARERLAMLGSPTILVDQALREAQDGTVQNPTDRTAVEALAQALTPVTETGAASNETSSASGQANPTVVATPGAGTTPAPAPAGQSSWLGPVVAFLLAFALGAIVLLRTAGLSLPSAGVLGGLFPSKARSESPERSSRPRQSVATLQTGAVPVRRVRHLNNGRLADEPTVDEEDDDEPSEERLSVRSASRGVTSLRPRAAASAVARRVSFESSYRLGDEPYDEIHPITDPTTGSLVAACGLGSALKLESTAAPRYYAFTAWVQDYVSGEQLHAVGFVTRSALDSEGARVDQWVREGQVDEVIPVRHGVTTDLKTDTITTRVSVVDVAHGDSGASDNYISRLTVRFDVSWDDD
ncbi:MAG TPA: hypothetical protein VNL16_09335 [Chloroflexota bacterium]|nr:hypothetical protein [Chloroflexota bacterium]